MFRNFDQISKKLKSRFFSDYDISNFTWFRTGGKVDLYCIIANEHELEIILNHLNNETPIFVIGAGSNVLIRDGGFRGIIIRLGKSFNSLKINGNLINSGAGILDVNLSKYACNNSLQGLEFFSGIPGSVGGAVKMNAGCYGFETKEVVKEITFFNKNGIKKNVSNKDLCFSYRNSKVSDDDIITSVIFEGRLGEKNKIESIFKKIKMQRETSQPIKTKTGGSTFKNPKGQFAAKLIEQADCKGLTFGDATISTKHSNFLINMGNATAQEIETLGKKVQDSVNKPKNNCKNKK